MGRIEEAIRRAQADRQAEIAAHTVDKMSGQNHRAPHINKKVGLPPAPKVPADHRFEVDDEYLREQRVIAASDYDERVGPYRQLRTNLLKTMRDNHWTTLAITSPNEGAGKSLTAANLAISLSRDVNTSVLLVDLDLTTPTTHRKLNLSPEMGLVDYLEGRAELEETLFDPGLPRLTVLAGRPAGKQSSELLASPKMQSLMKDLCQRDDKNVTIFDLPPLLRNDDAMLFAPFADATLLVVEDSVTTEDQLQQSIQLLDKATFIGTILNKAR